MRVFDLSSLVNKRLLGPMPGNLTDSSYQDFPAKSSQFSLIRPAHGGSNHTRPHELLA